MKAMELYALILAFDKEESRYYALACGILGIVMGLVSELGIL